MYLLEVAAETFVLIRATMSAKEARQLIEQLDCTHVIVHRTDPTEDYYYLYTKSEALQGLTHVADDRSVHTALNLHEWKATTVMDAYADAEGTPDRSVVVDEGRVIGLFDAMSRPPRTARGPPRDHTGPEDSRREPRALVGDFPEEVPVNQTELLLVSLSDTPGKRHPGVPIALPAGATVDIVVQPKRGFVLEGRGVGTLIVDDGGQTSALEFKLRATEPGPGRVVVLAFSQGHALGALTLAPSVVPATQLATVTRRSHERFVAPQNLRPPDLMLLIEEEQLKGKPALTLRLTAQDPSLGLNVKKFGPVEIEMDPLEYFKDFFNDIEGMPLATEQDRARAQERLAAKGSTLFESVMPKDLQALLWHLRKRIQSVVVQSSEPWIPWELCKLHGRGGNRVIEGPFMCEAFAVTRWLPEIGFKPTLTLKNMALVVPQDSGLWMADSERDYILALGNGDRHVERIPARYLEVRSALSRGTYDAWHFTGHSEFRTPDPNLSPIYLENKEQLTPDDLGGVQKNLGLARPLVFLNACQVGRSEMSLTGMGGWARQFLTADAGAFIGTYWGVYDHLAFEFAKAFYQQLLAGASIGKAAQEARRTVKSIKPPGNPTWLAYAVFADPLARVA